MHKYEQKYTINSKINGKLMQLRKAIESVHNALKVLSKVKFDIENIKYENSVEKKLNLFLVIFFINYIMENSK